MFKRWISGFLVFAFGFGCASVVSVATARESLEAGTLAEGLSYVSDGSTVTLFNNGKITYIVVVNRTPGTAPVDPSISYARGSMRISKVDIDKVVVQGVTSVAFMREDFWRPCNMGDCSWSGPVPPPPPPLPDYPGVTVLTPG